MKHLEQTLKDQARLEALQKHYKEGIHYFFDATKDSIPEHADFKEVYDTVSSTVTEAIKVVENINDDYSGVNDIACEYMLDVTQKTIAEYESIISCAKDIAQEYGLPEEDVIAKQRKQFFARLSLRDSKLDELYGMSATGQDTINQMVLNSKKHPEIISTLLNQFFEGYITFGLETDRFKENCDRFTAFTNALSSQGKLTEIGENISDGFKDSPNLLKFIITHAQSVPKNAFMQYHMTDIVMFFQEEPEIFNKFLKEALNEDSLFKFKLNDPHKNEAKEFQTSKLSNAIKFCAENNLEVDDENIKAISKNMNNFFLVNQKQELYANIEKLKVIKHNNELNNNLSDIASKNTSETDKTLDNITSRSFKL